MGSICASTTWRISYKEIGVIFQDYMRYEMTARENIAVGRIEFLDNLQKLQESARKSMANEVVAKLGAAGYDQMLGRRFETVGICPAENGESGAGASVSADVQLRYRMSPLRLWTRVASTKSFSDSRS